MNKFFDTDIKLFFVAVIVVVLTLTSLSLYASLRANRDAIEISTEGMTPDQIHRLELWMGFENTIEL